MLNSKQKEFVPFFPLTRIFVILYFWICYSAADRDPQHHEPCSLVYRMFEVSKRKKKEMLERF